MKNLIGVQINYKQDTDLDIAIQKAKEMGMESCQLNIWDMSVYTDEHASKINEAVKKHSFKAFGYYRIVLGALVLLFFMIKSL